MIQPTRGKFYCEVIKEEEITPSGIIIKADEKPIKARVISVGVPQMDKKGKPIRPCAKPGDSVYYKRGFGKEVVMDRKRYIFLKNDEIVGVENA